MMSQNPSSGVPATTASPLAVTVAVPFVFAAAIRTSWS